MVAHVVAGDFVVCMALFNVASVCHIVEILRNSVLDCVFIFRFCIVAVYRLTKILTRNRALLQTTLNTSSCSMCTVASV